MVRTNLSHFFQKFKLIYLGVASNLEKKSQENARKMSSLVGMAGMTTDKTKVFNFLFLGSAMTQIGVGIWSDKISRKKTTR